MSCNKMSRFSLLLVALMFVFFSVELLGVEREDKGEQTESIEQMTVLGSRVKGVGYEVLSVPVDLYWDDEILKTGTTDLGIALQRLAPSFHSKRNNLGDGSLFHTAILRGMSPDHTLILVNGKRRHNISFPRPLTFTTGFGTTGVDLRAIPIAAIDRIEVLRDGAATQYGSDAIGGVINILLKDSSDQINLSAMGGLTAEGDGERWASSINLGSPLFDRGYLNTTLEVAMNDKTDRAYDTRSIDPNGTHSDHPVRKGLLGEPEYDSFSLFTNMGFPINSSHDFFFFGGYSWREGISSGAWRDPVWAADRMLAPLHPDGFLPLEESTTQDLSLNVGWVASYDDWEIETSVQAGRNKFDFGALDSVNASWGAEWVESYVAKNAGQFPSVKRVIANAGPLSVDSGGTVLEQNSLNVDVTGKIDVGDRVLNMAFGGSYRQEDFKLRGGEVASWSCGLTNSLGKKSEFRAVGLDEDTNKVVLSDQLARCGHQGYPGYSPINVHFSSRDRSVQALYLDLQQDIFSIWGVDGSVRWEDYSDAGQSLTGKVGSRINLTSNLLTRFAASTGFRAPSLPNRGFNTIVFAGGDTNTGLSVTSHLDEGAAKKYFKVDENRQAIQGHLGHESSTNLSAGLVWRPLSSFDMSLDFYWIELQDRIGIKSMDLDCSAASRSDQCDAFAEDRSVPQVTNIQYYANAVDTETSGLDLVASYRAPMLTGKLLLRAGLHFNETEVKKNQGGLSEIAQSFIEDVNPKQKHVLSVDWNRGPLDTHIAFNYFGSTKSNWLELFPNCAKVDSAWITDAQVSYTFESSIQLAVGANNLFDVYPNKVSGCEESKTVNGVLGWGFPYNPDATYGVNGAVYYTSLRMSF